MKNWLKKNWSYALNTVLVLIVISLLWPQKETLADLSKFTQNDLSKSTNIKPGMSTEEILEIMGAPALKEIRGEIEEFHYCKTGHLVDEYISIKTNQGKLLDVSYYVVNWLDVAFHHTPTPNEHLLDIGGMGDCKLTIRWGTYGKETPNKSAPPVGSNSAAYSDNRV
ncbi:hypothetical protein PEKONANI_03883 [Aeromonas jandaei]|uniref:hypothetical protein n=1 Tax=Aeromonas jandaei TaxID=650 RepID=UPI003672C0CC